MIVHGTANCIQATGSATFSCSAVVPNTSALLSGRKKMRMAMPVMDIQAKTNQKPYCEPRQSAKLLSTRLYRPAWTDKPMTAPGSGPAKNQLTVLAQFVGRKTYLSAN